MKHGNNNVRRSKLFIYLKKLQKDKKKTKPVFASLLENNQISETFYVKSCVLLK